MTLWIVAESSDMKNKIYDSAASALGDILRDGTDRSQALPAATLLIRRGKELILLPPD